MSDRDREIERLTEVFKDAILHAPIPDVNPNLIRTVESQARECALRVVGDEPAEEGPYPGELPALRAVVRKVEQYARERETYGRLNRTVHSARIASDLLYIVEGVL